ncbi:MAG: dGTP triphosphohydrolase [Eubacterium sp.]
MMYWDMLLSPKRFREKETVERAENDERSPFKKDYDTVCNSTILRRLQDKAQVFPLEQEDYARTRLTHSIEVMSIAESLGMKARNIIMKHDKKFLSESRRKRDYVKELLDEIPTILKTVSLLHDMGNPPFGHLGEQIIGDWFAHNLRNLAINSDGLLVYKSGSDPNDSLVYKLKGKYFNDLTNFEGNAQLFRLVTKLNLFIDEYGMNLTFPVMASFIKYPTNSSSIDKKKLICKKVGYFSSEEDLYQKINETLGLNGYRHPLAFLLEAADDIAYLTADIEDAHRKGLITIDKIVKYFSEEKSDLLVDQVLKEISNYKMAAIKMEYEDVEGYVMNRTRVLIKGLMINSIYVAFDNAYDDIMECRFNDELLNCSAASTITRILRKIEKENIHYCSQILENKTRAYSVLTKLLEIYVPATVNWKEEDDKNKDTDRNLLYLSLSKNYRYICKQANKRATTEEEKIYNKLLLVTDQISGMTDTHALSVYKMITAN